MKKGQMTMDLLIAVLISMFIFTWIQGYIKIQATQAQETGLNQELTGVTTGIGSTMNAFYAMNPHSNDYAKTLTPRIRNFLTEPNTTITKETNSLQITINSSYEDKEAFYQYPVPQGITYHENCSETGGKPCAKP